jgi:phosphoenolpyruvate carboxykinase (GTP)
MALTENKAVLDWIDGVVKMTRPDRIVWIDGSEEQLEQLRRQAVEEGILIKLNQEKLPGCYLHRTDPNDVARVEDRTLICCEKEEDAGPTNHWMAPDKMRQMLFGKGGICDGAMEGRTMYVIPYSMSVVGSPFAKYGIELSDSIYVVLNMAIMTRMGKQVLDAMGEDSNFIKGIHCQCNLNKEDKYIVHFPETNEIVSVNSNYGGNVLQGKKCFALRIASNLGSQENWMAEHMLILGLENPRARSGIWPRPSPACGRRTLPCSFPGEVPEEGLEGLVRGRRYRLDPRGGGRPPLGREPGKRLFRRGPRHQQKIQPQRPGGHHAGHHLYQRGPQSGRQHRMVGGPDQGDPAPHGGLAGQPL